MKRIKRRMRYGLARHARLYEAAVTAQNAWRAAARRPHESEFQVLRHMPAGLTNADIGANQGQSALSIHRTARSPIIYSIEPNAALASRLDRVAGIIGDRFSYSIVGVADRHATLTLHIPVVGGRSLTGEATFEPAALERARRRIGDFTVRTVNVDVTPFDELDIQPAVVKIDVQGLERTVLEGMKSTLAEHRPMLIIEAQADDDEFIARMLADFGYRRWQVHKGRLGAPTGPRPLNWVYAVEGDERFSAAFA